MNPSLRLYSGGGILIAALLAAPASDVLAEEEETCVVCHRRRTLEHLRAPLAAMHDVHGSNDVLCSGCHGGRPDMLGMQAHDPGSGFTSGHHGFAQVAMCGSCHDGSIDNLQDVLTHYRLGSHMRAVTEGQPGARCSDCHGAHGILPPDDPEAPSARANISDTCGSCHARLGPEFASDQLRQWQGSVHGQAHAEGSEDAPTCADCHDPHENNAGLSAVARCGECHEQVRLAFEAGPHAEHFRSFGFLDCAECHDSHEVRSPDATLLTGRSATCSRCHRRGQEPFEHMRAIAAAVANSDQRRRALETTDPRRLAFMRAVHRLDLEAIEEAAEALPVVAYTPEPRPADDVREHMSTIRRWDSIAYAAGAVGAAVLSGLALLLWWRKRR